VTLVDASVWVTAKRGLDAKLTATLRSLVVADQVLAHDLIYLELLLGTGGDTRRQMLEDYRRLQAIETLPNDTVAKFCRDHHLGNRGIGAVDAHILAAAHAAGVAMWTLDRALAKVATGLRLETSPRGR
jgi:predicted nucleic acid-binding protein